MHGRVFLLAASAVLALVLGFWAVPPERALHLVTHYGYWVIMVTSLWFGLALLRLRRSGKVDGGTKWRALDAWDWVVVAGGTWLLTVHEPFGFKIIMDEVLLLGTSMSMHLDRVVQVPHRGHDIQGVFILLAGEVDKRPLFFPFLLSVLHDLIGYRPANAWGLNVALTGAVLALTLGLVRRWLGRVPAWTSVALLAGLPLLSQNATGGGFEVLNLTMILVCTGLAVRVWEQRGEREVAALGLGTALLAQVRYESALFVLPAALTVGLLWWRERRWIIPPALIATPLLLLPVPLLQKIFVVNPEAWQLASKPEMASPFALGYVFENLAHNWAFFFSTDILQPNSWLFAGAGLVALIFMLLYLVRLPRAWSTLTPAERAVSVYAGTLLLLFALLLSYFWGRFDDPIIARLSLPVHLLFLYALWLVVPRLPRPGRWWGTLLVLALVQLWGWSLPAMANHAYTLNYLPGREITWRREFMASQSARDYLVIDPFSTVWITHGISGTPPEDARTRMHVMAFNFRNRMFREMYVFQRYDVNPDTGALVLNPEYDPGPAYHLETVAERRLSPLIVSRLSRVVTIDVETPDAAVARPPEADQPTRDEINRAYRDQWLRNLP
jgi:hypothetical protein